MTSDDRRQASLDIADIERNYLVYNKDTSRPDAVDWTRMSLDGPLFRRYIYLRQALRAADKVN